MAGPDLFATTLRALAAPRRAAPIALVVAALVGVQLYYGREPRVVVVPAAMALGFVALAPWSWRAWLAAGWSVKGAAQFAAAAILVVLTCGWLLPRVLGLGPTYFTDPGSLAISVVLYAVGGWGLGRDIELEHGLEHVRLVALHAHLDPHFLYNTLNAIAEWCAEDAAVAEQSITRLAAMLRELHEGLERTRWPLERELALVADLLELHRIRDPEALTFTISVEEPLRAVELPPLVVLTLVENAVKHGPRAGHRGLIEVEVTGEGPAAAGVRCEVRNPGRYEPGPGPAGRGLRTLRQRLAHAYRSQATLTIGTGEVGTLKGGTLEGGTLEGRSGDVGTGANARDSSGAARTVATLHLPARGPL